MVAVKPCFGSVSDTLITSPWPIRSVCAFVVNVARSTCCGPGGPVGMPLVCRNATLSVSGQLSFIFLKLNCDSRLKIASDAHQEVRLQLRPSAIGGKPGGKSCTSTKEDPAASGELVPTLA